MDLRLRSLVLLLLPLAVLSQDLTGVWEGDMASGGYLKLVIIKVDSSYIGYTYDREGGGWCKVNFAGTYNTRRGMLKGEGQGVIEKSPDHAQCSYKLFYGKDDKGEFLEGLCNLKSTFWKILSLGMGTAVRLERSPDPIDTTLYMQQMLNNKTLLHKLPAISPDSINTAITQTDTGKLLMATVPWNADSLRAVKQSRHFDTLQTYTTKAGTITISIYDNGVADGDSVTVFHNNEVLFSKLLLENKPVKVSIDISAANPHHEFVLIAENLGRIPPNTAMLVIDDGKQQYRLKAPSDLQKNALVIFDLK